MKKIIIFCLSLIFLVACKSKENSEQSSDTKGDIVVSPEPRVINGKVLDNKRKKVAFAAVKLYLDEDDCLYAYTDNNGAFEFKVDELRIKDQSHFEVVYKGFAVNMSSLRNYEKDKAVVIKLSKKGTVVPIADYNIFYESIKSCGDK